MRLPQHGSAARSSGAPPPPWPNPPVGVAAEIEPLLVECESLMRDRSSAWREALTYDTITIHTREHAGRTAFRAELDLLDCAPGFAAMALLARNPTRALSPALRVEEQLEAIAGAEGMLDRLLVVRSVSSFFGFSVESVFAVVCRRLPGRVLGLKLPVRRVPGATGARGWTLADGPDVHTALAALSIAPAPAGGSRVTLVYAAERLVSHFLPAWVNRRLVARFIAVVALRATRFLASRAAGEAAGGAPLGPSFEELFHGLMGVPRPEGGSGGDGGAVRPGALVPPGGEHTMRPLLPGILRPESHPRYEEAARASLDMTLHLEHLSLGSEMSRLRARAGFASSVPGILPMPRDAPNAEEQEARGRLRGGPEPAAGLALPAVAPAEEPPVLSLPQLPPRQLAPRAPMPSDVTVRPPAPAPPRPAPSLSPRPASSRRNSAPPSNGYVLFCKELRPSVDAQCPGWSSREKATRLGELWRAAPQEERDAYTRRARALRLAAAAAGAAGALPPTRPPRPRKRPRRRAPAPRASGARRGTPGGRPPAPAAPTGPRGGPPPSSPLLSWGRRRRRRPPQSATPRGPGPPPAFPPPPAHSLFPGL
eukprot:tig00000615_g2584.t1